MSDSPCYQKTAGTISSVNNTVLAASDNGLYPCGSNPLPGQAAISCCWEGHFCTEDGFCHYQNTSASVSGWYLAGCTDPNFQDPACPTQCANEKAPDAIWNATSQTWQCCGRINDIFMCNDPQGPIFQGPAPDRLFNLGLVHKDGGNFSSASSTASPSPPSSLSGSPSAATPALNLIPTPSTNATSNRPSTSSTFAPPSGQRSGLTTGSIVAAVVCTVLGTALIAVGAFLLGRRRHLMQPNSAPKPNFESSDGAEKKESIVDEYICEAPSNSLYEMPHNSVPVMLDSRSGPRYEVP